MTTKLIIYESLLRDEILIEDVTEEKNLAKTIHGRIELKGLYTSAWVNDTLIPPEDWHLFELTPFDTVHLIGQPQKGSLPIIGAIAGVALSAAFPALWPISTGYIAGILKGAAIGYAIGSIADSLIFPPTVPLVSSESENPNYGWDGARLVTRPDGPVSVVYGQHRVSGALIMQYVSTDGNKNYLHMLINLGEGRISGIMKSDGTGVCTSTSDTPDIEINGQAFSNYQNTTWDYRLGTWDQTVIDGFHGTKTFIDDGRKVSNGTPITVTTTGTGLTTLKIQLIAAQLYSQLDNGDIVNHYIDFLVQYRLTGDSTWIDGERTGSDGVSWFDGKTTSKIYRYVTISGLTAGQYDVKVTRISPDYTGFKIRGDLYLGGITEQSDEDIAYRNSALLALKLQATDQLSGTTPNVTAEIRGKVVSVPKLTIAAATQTYDDCYWDDDAATYKRTSDDETCTDTGLYVDQWSRHPIWCSKDFILNTRYGLGNYIDSGSFDIASAVIEARYCWEMVTDFDSGTEHRFEMDLPISTFTSAPEAVKLLARTYRGWIIWSDGTYKPVIDRAKDAVWLFNSSNMFPETLKTTYFKASGIPNVVEVQYADADRDYVINTLEVVDESEWTSKKPLRKITTSAIGTVRTSQNLRDGKYQLNTGIYVTKAIEFEVPEYLLHVEPGDTVRMSDDLLAWGVGGRIVSATSNSITTNIDITYTSSYEVRVRLPDNSIETKTVTSVTNNNRTLNISGSFTATPLVDSVFTYGASDVDSKPFKVKTITRAANDTYKLLVSEESSNKYSDTSDVSLPDPKYTTLPNPAEAPDNIENLTLTEMSNRPGFYISFNIPQESITFHHVDILLSLDNSNFWVYRSGITNSSDIEAPNTKPGTIYYVKAISYNHIGVANFSPATASITTTDTNFRPPQINGLRLDGESSNNTISFTKKDAKFTWVQTSVVDGAGHLPAGQEPLGVDQFFDGSKIKYWVEIYVSGSQVRREIITEHNYVYTYEKNLADNDGTPTSSFTIKVWAYNEDGNLKSLDSTDLAVSNPAPGVITNLTITGTSSATEFVGKDINLSWTEPSDPDILNYKVVVTKTDDTVLRTEYSTDRFYTYDFNMNADDNSDTPINAVKINVYTQDWFSQLSSVTTISVSNPAPATVSGLVATALPRAVNFIWTRNTENDIDYYTYRTQVESDGWSDWNNTNTNHISRTLTEDEISDHTSAAIIYIEIKAVDTFGTSSATAASANATSVTMDIAATDIDDFAITASKTFTKIPILESDSWTNDSPSSGSVAWNEHNLYYNGVKYTIAADNTDKKYIYWLNGLSLYNYSDTNPTLTDGDFVIAVNISGTHDLAWNAIANQVIGSAYIEDAAITNAKIISLAAEKIVADELSAISANLGSITSGYIDSVEIVSSTFKTATSAKRIEITSEGIALHVTDLTGKYGNFKWGDGTKYGAGVLAYIQHDSFLVPFYIKAEQAVADFHYYNRTSNPTGAAELGDVAMVGNVLKKCTVAGTPGTWKGVGTAAALFTNVLYPDPSASDQGATDATYDTVKDLIDGIGSTENATLAFRHNGVGNTTTYTFGTDENITGNITVIIEPGAVISFSDNIVLTIRGTFKAVPETCFSWNSGVYSVPVSFAGASIVSPGKTIRVFPEWWGAIPDGSTNCSPGINAAIRSFDSSGGIVELGIGVYHLHSAITMSGAAVTLNGLGFNSKWATAPRNPNLLDGGTWLYIEDTGFDAITVSAWFCKILNIGFFWLQPENIGGWTPTEYGYAIGTDYSATHGELHDLLIEHIFLLNATYGIRIGASEANHNVGGIDIKDIHGQVFKIGIDLVNITDFSRVRDIHFIHGYWAGGAATVYQRANAISIRLGNTDGLHLSNISSFYNAYGIQIIQTAYGTASAIMSDLMFECKVGLWVTNSVTAGCTIQVSNFSAHATETESYGIVIHGDSVFGEFNNIKIVNSDYNAVAITGTGNVMAFDNLDFRGHNDSNTGKTAFNINAGNLIQIGSQRRFAPANAVANFDGAGAVSSVVKDGEGLGAWSGPGAVNKTGSATLASGTAETDLWITAVLDTDVGASGSTGEVTMTSGGTMLGRCQVHKTYIKWAQATAFVKNGDAYSIDYNHGAGTVRTTVYILPVSHWKHAYN